MKDRDMNKMRYMLAVAPILLILPIVCIAKNVGYIYYPYNRINLLRSRLIDHKIVKQGGEKFEEFRYDISRDTDSIKKLRNYLDLCGIYVSDDSNMKMYEEYSKQHPIPKQYILNRFNKFDFHNSISKSFFRLFQNIHTRISWDDELVDTTQANYHLNPTYLPKWVQAKDDWITLLWELEDLLPKDFDVDDTGNKFLAFFGAMLPGGNYHEWFTRNISTEWDQRSRMILLAGIAFWIHYTMRFKYNKGLSIAYKSVINHWNDSVRTLLTLINDPDKYLVANWGYPLHLARERAKRNKWASDVINPLLKEWKQGKYE